MNRLLHRLAAGVAVVALVAAALVLLGTPSRPIPSPAVRPAADLSQFDPGNIISDAVFFDGAALGVSEIQSFLNIKGASCVTGSDGTPCLKNYVQDTTNRAADGLCNGYAGAAQEPASTILFKVQQSCGVSAKVLLVVLQKEQGLVTSTGGKNLSVTRYQKAMGYACPDTAACDSTYYGFQNQVYSAAWQYKRYATYPNNYGYRARQTSSVLYNPNGACGSSPVYIQNQATAGLYIYTPYQPNAAALAAGYGTGDGCSSYGNRNFWLYFTDWFGSTQVPGSSASLPLGSLDAVTSSYGMMTAGGWALDPDDPTASISVNMYIDGVFAGAQVANGPRPDVAAAYPGSSQYHGFSLTALASLGMHQVCVYGINIGVGTVNPQLGCQTINNQDAGAPLGSADAVVPQPGSIRVGGWAFDPDLPDGPIQVHAYLDGVFAGALTADNPRPDVGTAFGVGPNHGFNGIFAAATGNHTLCLYAINVGPGSVNTPLTCTAVVVPDPAAYNPAGALDAVLASGGTMRISGWTYDPDTPSSPIAVHVYVDGVFKTQLMTSFARPDVLKAVPGVGGTPGFYYSTVLPAGRHQVCAFGINVGFGNANTPIGCGTVTTVDGAAANPIGNVDGAFGGSGTLSVVGWAYDPDATPGPTQVHFYVDGTWTAATETNVSRPDVARVVPGAGQNQGFAWSGNAAPGQHQVCAYAINVGAGNMNTPLGCRTVTVTDPALAHNPVGSVDAAIGGVGEIRVGGWAYDVDAGTAPITVHVYIDGQWTAAVTAGDPRPDIATAIPGAGPTHGFNWAGTATAGQHTVCVYAINVGEGNLNTGLACRAVTVG